MHNVQPWTGVYAGSIFDIIERWVGRHPDKCLYSFMDVSGAVIARHTYRSFLERVDLIASHLRARRGLKPGDRVLLVFQPGLEMICSLFACSRAGVIPVPTSPPSHHGLTAALYRLAHIAQDSQASLLLTSRECHELIHRSGGDDRHTAIAVDVRKIMELDWIVTEDLAEPSGVSPVGPVSDIFFLQYTSGSTSGPKGVMVSPENIKSNCQLVVDHEMPVTVSWLPQHHDMGLLGYYIYILLAGGTTHGFSPTTFIQRPSLWLETITKERATASSAPNFAYEYCLRPGRIAEATLAGIDLSSLRVLMAAAEPIKTETYRRFLRKFEACGLKPDSYFVAFGLAENTLCVTNYGQAMASINKKKMAEGFAVPTQGVSEIGSAIHLMSCGKPQGDNVVKIVSPETCTLLNGGMIGEIWVRGSSKCLGYWNNPTLTDQTFRARIEGEGADGQEYFRTGDMGFLQDGELYVCGRRKDMIIIRGQNYYPHDIESVVEQTSPLVRKSCVAAFEVDDGPETSVVVVAEVSSPKAVPDARAIVAAIRSYLGIDVDVIAFIPPKSVPKTSSGKTMRFRTRQMWLAEEFTILGQFVREKAPGEAGEAKDGELPPFEFIKRRYRLTGKENYSLIEAGMDSIDLVVFVHEMKELLKLKDAKLLADQVDFRLVQQVSVAELFTLADLFHRAPKEAVERFQAMLTVLREKHRIEERAQMMKDRELVFVPKPALPPDVSAQPRSILLTGGTGFVGPFLIKSLMEQTRATIHVLVRAPNESDGRDRLRAALESAVGSNSALLGQFDSRVRAVCGDLEKPSLGMAAGQWERLAGEVDTVYHNAAAVNYLFAYATMRAANVGGTNEALRFAFEQRRKPFNLISTTFIFGWATKDVLSETDNNDEMELLDFGYSQSKWVSEQVVFSAARQGLPIRVFRPALVTPSTTGGGNNFDITIRLLAFMVKHGVGVDTLNQVSFMPADVTANNIVSISNLPESIGKTFHVTRDEYSNMMDITNIITARTGRHFQLFSLKDFVPEVIRRCTRDDLLYPLLDFLIGSVDNISAMEFKRYDSSVYQQARNASPRSLPDPSLDATVGGILRFMTRTGIA